MRGEAIGAERVVRRLGPGTRLLAPDLPSLVLDDLPPVSVVRPSDLVNLTFTFSNLGLTGGRAGSRPPTLGRRLQRTPALLTVTFPSQHITEKAFFEGAGPKLALGNVQPLPDPPDPDTKRPQGEGKVADPDFPYLPVESIIGGPTQLVFIVRDEQIPFTLEGLLDACTRLELLVPNNALPAPERVFLFDPVALLRDKASIKLTASERTARNYEAVYRLRSMVGSLAYRFGPAAAVNAAQHLEVAPMVGAIERLVLDAARLRAPVGHVRRPARRPLVPSDPFAAGRTAIELPFRLLLAPHSGVRFRHAPEPVNHAGRVELWHSRLGEPGPLEVDRAPTSRTVRAVWTRDWGLSPRPFTPHPDPINDFPDASGQDDDPGWRMPLNANDRMGIVHQTSNFDLHHGHQPWVPEAVSVRRLMLSSLGGWLDSRVAWDTQPTGFSLEEWRHRAALGRDFYVKVVRAGFLFPFGHRASLVKITERRIDDQSGEPVAWLFQRMFVIVKEPHKEYGRTGFMLDDGRQADLLMPLRSITFLTRVTPPLSPPDSPYKGLAGSSFLFFPEVDGARFPFKVVAADLEGNLVEFAIPLLFVEKPWNDKGVASIKNIANKYNIDPDVAGRLNGQRLAFAPHSQTDDTSLDVASMRFDGQPFDAAQDEPKFTPTLRDAQAVVPAIRHLSGNPNPVQVSYLKEYATSGFGGGNAGEVFLKVENAPLDFSKQSDRSGGLVSPSIQVSALSRKTGPVGGKPETVAKGDFDPSEFFAGLDGANLFGVVKLTDLIAPLTGGFAGDLGKIPQFVSQSVSVVASLTTDLMTLKSMAGLGTDGAAVRAQATAFITALDPNKLKTPPTPDPTDLKTAIDSALTNQAAALAQPARRDVAATLARVRDMLTNLPLGEILTAFGAGAAVPEIAHAHLEWHPDMVDLKIITPDPTKGKMSVIVDLRAAPGSATPVADVSCRIEHVNLNLLPHPNDFITLPFEHITFEARAGKKPEVDVKLGGLHFLGVLQFVEKLQEFIPSDGFSDPPYLDVDSTGLTAGFSLALPSIAVGVFSLENISLGAELRVPFIGEALEFSFRFCTREKPFHLIVSLFGGGGFFGITITPNGLKVLEAALEFGAEISINLGVASGGVSIMAGIYFRMEMVGTEAHASLTGYLRIRGEVDVLGLISACIELYMSFTYEFSSGKCVGRATIHVEVHVLFFSGSVAVSAEKKFAGSKGDPTFADLMAPVGTKRPWDEYCRSFAAVP